MTCASNRLESAVVPGKGTAQETQTKVRADMKKRDLEAMSIESLWALHEQVTMILARRLSFEKRELEKRLATLGDNSLSRSNIANADEPKPRRKYPRVLPKYFNPSMPTQTWSGRGKKPRWLVGQLKAGHKLEEFRIDRHGDPRHNG